MRRKEKAGPLAVIQLSEDSSADLPLETLHACLTLSTEAATLQTTQALTPYKNQKEHQLWVPYATLCMLPQSNTSLVYIYTKQHYCNYYQLVTPSAPPPGIASTCLSKIVYNATNHAVLQHHVVGRKCSVT